jgi:sensor histidine kinase YesM
MIKKPATHKYKSPLLKGVKRSDYYINKSSEISDLVYWMSCLIMVVLSILIGCILVPLMLILSGAVLFSIISFLGMIVGIIFSQLVFRIEHLKTRHHLFAALLIPVMGLFNVFMISNLTNKMNEIYKIKEMYNDPFVLSLFFASFMLLPYLYGLSVSIKKRK